MVFKNLYLSIGGDTTGDSGSARPMLYLHGGWVLRESPVARRHPRGVRRPWQGSQGGGGAKAGAGCGKNYRSLALTSKTFSIALGDAIHLSPIFYCGCRIDVVSHAHGKLRTIFFFCKSLRFIFDVRVNAEQI